MSERTEWISEMLSILDESQAIRERLEKMPIAYLSLAETGIAISSLLVLEKILGDAVDNDLAATAAKISTDISKK